jgi:hypothetical protein
MLTSEAEQGPASADATRSAAAMRSAVFIARAGDLGSDESKAN